MIGGGIIGGGGALSIVIPGVGEVTAPGGVVAGTLVTSAGLLTVHTAWDNLNKVEQTNDEVHTDPPSNENGKGKKPTPETNPEEFTKQRGDQGYINKKTGEIYKKSHTSHGNKGNVGTQWKIWPKGTTDFGGNSKSSGTRTTVDGDGNVIGN